MKVDVYEYEWNYSMYNDFYVILGWKVFLIFLLMKLVYLLFCVCYNIWFV